MVTNHLLTGMILQVEGIPTKNIDPNGESASRSACLNQYLPTGLNCKTVNKKRRFQKNS